MIIDYNDIRKFILNKHSEAEKGTISNFVTFLQAKLNNEDITDLQNFEEMTTVDIQRFINLKNCYWFIEYLQSKGILDKDEDLEDVIKRIQVIAQQRDDVDIKAVHQLIFFIGKKVTFLILIII